MLDPFRSGLYRTRDATIGSDALDQLSYGGIGLQALELR